MSPPRRVLVAAKHIALDRTSEGLCTARLISALVDSGHEVRCLTTETASSQPPLRSEVEVFRIPTTGGRPWSSVARAVDPAEAATPAGRRLRSLTRLAVTVGTGREPRSWSETASWRRGLRRHRIEFAPDLVIVRGGGSSFEAHLAMARERRAGPWVAHYHDPYPLSAYPPSYAHHTPILSAQQERANRRILRRATLVTFPSNRLADWTERTSGVDLENRRVVLSHVGGAVNDDPGDAALINRLCGDRSFLLVHTGTLLGQRSPVPLLRAFRRLLAAGADQERTARLVFLGKVDRRHRADDEFLSLCAELEATGNLRVVDSRTDHATALALARRSTASVLIESDDPESPFFPAKLADYLAADIPIIALSPPHSVTRDLLGLEYPLWCAPGDENAIAGVLNRLWVCWCSQGLSALRPPEAARRAVSPGQAAIAVDEIVERVLGE